MKESMMKIVHMIISEDWRGTYHDPSQWTLTMFYPHDQENGFHCLFISITITYHHNHLWNLLEVFAKFQEGFPLYTKIAKVVCLNKKSSLSSSPPSSSPSPPAALWWLPSDCEQMEKLGTSWKSIWNVINQDDIANCDCHSDEYQGLLWKWELYQNISNRPHSVRVVHKSFTVKLGPIVSGMETFFFIFC